jgi:hypothetical protein
MRKLCLALVFLAFVSVDPLAAAEKRPPASRGSGSVITRIVHLVVRTFGRMSPPWGSPSDPPPEATTSTPPPSDKVQ